MLKLRLLLLLLIFMDKAFATQSLWTIEPLSNPVTQSTITEPSIDNLNVTKFSIDIDKLKTLSNASSFLIPINEQLQYLVNIKQKVINNNSSVSYKGDITVNDISYPVVITVGEHSFYGYFFTDIGNFTMHGKGSSGIIYEDNITINSSENDYAYTRSVSTPSKHLSQQYSLVQKSPAINLNDTSDVSANIANISILIVYNKSVNELFNGDVLTKINHLFAVTNSIFSTSRVHITINIADAIELDYPDNISLQEALNDITFGTSADIMNIKTRRYETAADMVVFILSPNISDATVSAYAWINGKNASVERFVETMYSSLNINSSDYVLAHELGHNLGLQHSRRQAPNKGATFDFALGYGVEQEFVTIMAYKTAYSAQQKIFRFSNPEQNCQLLPCGLELGELSANATLALNLVRFQAQNLQQYPPNLTLTTAAISEIDDLSLLNCLSDEFIPTNKIYAGMLYSLSCINKNIDSLVGLLNFPNLHTLKLNTNTVSSIQPLKTLNKLKWLDLSANNISDISPLFHLTDKWDHLNLLANPVFCWQLAYLEKYEVIYDLYKPENCVIDDDLNDFDYDGISNIEEINNNTDPIINALGHGQAQFQYSTYQFEEANLALKIMIERHNGNLGSLTVNVSAENTANQENLANEEKVNYRISPLQITFNEGESSKILTLNINDDLTVEIDEIFYLRLSHGEYTTTAQVIILDNDFSASNTIEPKRGSGPIPLKVLYFLIMCLLIKYSKMILKEHRND